MATSLQLQPIQCIHFVLYVVGTLNVHKIQCYSFYLFINTYHTVHRIKRTKFLFCTFICKSTAIKHHLILLFSRSVVKILRLYVSNTNTFTHIMYCATQRGCHFENIKKKTYPKMYSLRFLLRHYSRPKVQGKTIKRLL